MKEKPIIFSTAMVQAILEGRKTQTRRIIKVPHDLLLESAQNLDVWYDEKSISYRKNGKLLWHPCPYGQPGDLLWVRESFAVADKQFNPNTEYEYKAEYLGGAVISNWKPSIHMPRSAARIFLKVENVRVERLDEISWVDAICEGVDCKPDRNLPLYRNYTEKEMITEGLLHNCLTDPRLSFQSLWDIINGTRAPWSSNPWVWVVEFSRIENYKPQ